MGKVVVGREAAQAAAAKSIAALEARFASRVESLIHEVDAEIKALTPVYTGQAVRNMIWSMDVPDEVTHEAIDNGPTGHTNQMALGQEPRRKVNEDAAAESLAALDFKSPFHRYFLTNNSPDIVGLELGTLPPPPMKQRSPNGMFKLIDAFIKARVAAKGFLE